MAEYTERDIRLLDKEGSFYSRHVQSMTAEGLHDKAAIAAELAHRDYEISYLREEAGRKKEETSRLEAENARLRERLSTAREENDRLRTKLSTAEASEAIASQGICECMDNLDAAKEDGRSEGFMQGVAWAAAFHGENGGCNTDEFLAEAGYSWDDLINVVDAHDLRRIARAIGPDEVRKLRAIERERGEALQALGEGE